ncbi:MAG: YceI family protein [Opitutaceae bacterium]
MMKSSLLLASIALAFAATSPSQAAVETYKIDPAHSSVGFKVRHFFTPVPGSFGKFEGTIKVDRDNLENSSIDATIDTTSIDTANERRDKHLRSDDFFLVETYPKITFKSTSWKKTGDENEFEVTGDLTIKDVTKSVVLNVDLLGFGPGARDAYISGWQAETELDRNDFGITYGPAVVGSEVDITITVEAARQG